MTVESLAVALARLERAVARVEGAVTTRTSGHEGAAEAYARLDERHTVLRTRIQDTIERLDAMIGGAG